MNKADFVILLIVFIFMIWGYYKGLVKSVLSVVQYFAVIILSLVLAPHVATLFIEKFNLDVVIVNWVRNNGNLFFDALGIVSDEMLQNIAGRLINILAVILLLIALKIIFSLIIDVLNNVANLPILGLVNRTGGVVIGAINGILVIYLLILLINWVPFENFNEIKSFVETSSLGAVISNFVPEVATDVIELVKISV